MLAAKDKCFACSACLSICSNNAIKMKEDKYGFDFPHVDEEKCIACGMCEKVCNNLQLCNNKVKKTYVATTMEKDLLANSTSGGIFSTIAKEILRQGGIVAGCSMEREKGVLQPKHIIIYEEKDLYKLQGSKYVQSYIGNIFCDIRTELKIGQLVLFSGTPCQIAGLKSYLGNRSYKALFTIDIVCHGVPSAHMFQNYLKIYENKLSGEIVDFKFRDKSKGWCQYNYRVTYIDKSGKIKSKIASMYSSSYYKMFFDSIIYRKNCYECPFTSELRPSDITIGDYWGIEKVHPEYMEDKAVDIRFGTSCILVNTENGDKLLKKYGLGINLKSSFFEKVAQNNKQLIHPSIEDNRRSYVMELFSEQGYEAVEQWYCKNMVLKKFLYIIWSSVPKKIKDRVKILLNKFN